jgi:hypothetical protein
MTRANIIVLAVVLLAAQSGCGQRPAPRTGVELQGVDALEMTASISPEGLTSLVVQNVSDVSLMISRGVEIEALEVFGVEHESHELEDFGIEATDFFLVEDCEQPARGCLTIEPGETIRSVPWTGYYAEPQCPRETPSDYAAPSGRYRFVITACGGGQRFPGPPFDHAMSANQ